MTVQGSADRIREGLKRFRGERLVQKGGYPGQFSINGGDWVSKRGGCVFSILPGHHWAFRLRSGFVQPMYVWDAKLVFDGLDPVGISITRWLEEATREPFPRSSPNVAYCSHITVQRINYTDPFYSRIEGLSDSDLEDIRSLIEKPLQDLLGRSIEEVRPQQKYAGGLAVSVVGELHWNWRNPMPELLAVQEEILDFTATFKSERVASRPLSRYKLDNTVSRREWSCAFTVEGEPSVRVLIPSEDRENPDIFDVVVEISGMVIPVRVERMSPVPLGGVASFHDGPILDYYLLFHPCGVHFAPYPKAPSELSRAIGDRAVEHLKNAWLARELGLKRDSRLFVDVLIA